MSAGVRAALIDLFRDRTGGDAAAGEAWLGRLSADERYLVDVWASG
jgi:cytochrome P450/NADPH-cytochrome P450 reductase